MFESHFNTIYIVERSTTYTYRSTTEMENTLSSQQCLGNTQENANASTNNNTSSGGKGGWITSPFFIGTKFAMALATGVWYSNLIVFLINEFNMNSIDAALINYAVSGSASFFPVVGALLADCLLGSYVVIIGSTLLSLLGTIMFIMMVTVTPLKPQSCNKATSIVCKSPTSFQTAFLYIALTFASIGDGGSRLTLATMGADQHDNMIHRETILDCVIFTLYLGWVLSFTVIVYIEDNVSWTLGLGIGVAANVIAVVLFLCGTPLYRRIMPQGSPFTSIARVFVASIRKMKMELPLESQNIKCYYYQNMKHSNVPPSKSLRFLNRAAMIEVDGTQEAKKGKSWRLCSVEEVEDLKKLIKLFPIWSAGIFYSVPIGINQSLVVLQALVMDRRLGNHNFKIPAGTFVVFNLWSLCLAIMALEGIVYPLWKRVAHRTLRPLQRLGLGHCFNIMGMIGFALVERKRLSIVRVDHMMGRSGFVVPMSALWLVIPLGLTGIGEAFQFPGEVAFQYQEFPRALRNTSAGVVSLRIAIGYYISVAFISLIKRTTSWLPDDINHGRVDYVYWLIAGIALLNFGYYFTFARLYKYNNLSMDDDDDGDL